MKRISKELQFEKYESIDELSAHDQELIKQAHEAQKNSYVPYSNYKVGAAIRLTDGTIVRGSNQENAAFSPSICAERAALFAIGNMGKAAEVSTIAIVAGSLHHSEKELYGAPCGPCRQVMREFEDRAKTPITVLFMTNKGSVYKTMGIDNLLPFAFGPEDLE